MFSSIENGKIRIYDCSIISGSNLNKKEEQSYKNISKQLISKIPLKQTPRGSDFSSSSEYFSNFEHDIIIFTDPNDEPLGYLTRRIDDENNHIIERIQSFEKGIGTKMVKYVCSFIKKNDFWAENVLDSAMGFWTKMNFKFYNEDYWIHDPNGTIVEERNASKCKYSFKQYSDASKTEIIYQTHRPRRPLYLDNLKKKYPDIYNSFIKDFKPHTVKNTVKNLKVVHEEDGSYIVFKITSRTYFFIDMDDTKYFSAWLRINSRKPIR